MLEAWMIWIGLGILCMIIEIFTPGFYFMSVGLGAILTGLASLIVPGSTWQILIFSIITFLIFLFTRKLSKKLMSKTSEETNIFALKGKKGKVIKEIPEDGRGYIKINGEEWSAISSEEKVIKKGYKVIVLDFEGNKLIVKEVNGEV